MSKEQPDYQDVDIILRLYDLRREAVMRRSRDAIFREFQPRSWEDVAAVVSNPQHPLNVCYRQVSSYWEMAAGFVRHGVLNPELFAENCGEAMFLFAKIQPHLPKLRETSPTTFQNLEWLVQNVPAARRRLEIVQARLKAMARQG
jgi:hypothetical protein